MPSRSETMSIAVDMLDSSLSTYGNSLDRVWLSVYETLLWYVTDGRRRLPHIIDANYLRSSERGKGSKKWIQRAIKVNDYVAKEIGISPDKVPECMDNLMRHKDFAGMQRQNPLG